MMTGNSAEGKVYVVWGQLPQGANLTGIIHLLSFVKLGFPLEYAERLTKPHHRQTCEGIENMEACSPPGFRWRTE
jgi:hypothetical protein